MVDRRGDCTHEMAILVGVLSLEARFALAEVLILYDTSNLSPRCSLLLGNKFNSSAVSESAQAANHSNSLVAQETLVAEFFASMHITDVDFDKRNSDSTQSIAQSDTGMRQASRVDDNIIAFSSCFVNAIDNVALVI